MSILTHIKRLIAVAIIAMMCGCAPNGAVLLECRHKSVVCALAMAEEHGGINNVAIAIGPSIGASHAQAVLYEKGTIKWIKYDGVNCYIGEREMFFPDKYLPVYDYVRMWK